MNATSPVITEGIRSLISAQMDTGEIKKDTWTLAEKTDIVGMAQNPRELTSYQELF
jgi:hypothetical protein